jgi:hypothetical protein
MDNYFNESHLKLLNYIDDTIKLTKAVEENADLDLLKMISSTLKSLASDLDEYVKNIKRQQLKKELNKLKTDILGYQANENAICEEIFCKLIMENLPDNVDQRLINSNTIELRTSASKDSIFIGTISITGDEKLLVDVKFDMKPEINKHFVLPNYNCIYSVINYVNLALGYSEKL